MYLLMNYIFYLLKYLFLLKMCLLLDMIHFLRMVGLTMSLMALFNLKKLWVHVDWYFTMKFRNNIKNWYDIDDKMWVLADKFTSMLTDVTEKDVELYDSGVSSSPSHTRSELEMYCKDAVTLFLSFFSILWFSLFLFFLLSSDGYIQLLVFFSVYVLAQHSWLLMKPEEYKPYTNIHRPFSFFFLCVYSQCKEKTAACHIAWLVRLWQLHLMIKRMREERKKKRKKSLFSLDFPLDFSCVVQCLRVVYAVHDNDVNSA